jgi:hypothetical protein
VASTEPVVGAQRKEAQSLQGFLSEPGWCLEQVNLRRVELLVLYPSTAPNREGVVLVINEHGDRKWAKRLLIWAGSATLMRDKGVKLKKKRFLRRTQGSVPQLSQPVGNELIGIPPLRRTRFSYAAVDSLILSPSKSAGLL